MSALITKEIYSFFKEQKIYIFIDIIFLICAFLHVPEVSMFMILASGMFASSSIMTDEKSGWDKTSKLLPVSNAAAVASKYVFGSIMIILTAVMFSAVIILSGKSVTAAVICVVAAVLAALLQAVNIPLIYIFSTNARTIANCVITGVIYAGAAFFLPYENGDALNNDIFNSPILKTIFSAKPITLITAAFAIVIVLNIISYFISAAVFSRKEL